MTPENTHQELQVVGQSVLRRDGPGHVKGTTVYYEDRQINGLLHLKMVRSPVPHGKLNGIDFSEAEKVQGFVAHLTHEDVPNNIYTILRLIGVGPDDEPVLAENRVRWQGEAVAAIIAETAEAAQRAASLVKLDIEELPPVLDVEEALQPGAPIIADTGVNYFIYENDMDHRQVRLGDVEKGFAEADFIVESRFQSSPIEHAPTETTGCIVVPESDGRYTVYTNTQALFFTLDNSGITLNLPFEKMHFVGGTVGGGFGGKVDVIVEPIAILGAIKTGRPVKFKYSRREEMANSSPRGAWRLYYKDGVMKDGRIVARKVTTYADSGAYNRHTPYAVTKHAANAAGPYNIPNVAIDAYCVYTNKAPSSAMRGFAVTMSTWAIEQQMDKIAETVGIDPWSVRFINAYKDGDMKPHRKVVEDATLIEVMQAAAEMAGVDLPQEYKEMSSMENGHG
jgi:CO/xanthine dehydrogenase Mo-binding subunit